MNCHYIPRLLLRKFAENDKVNSYDLRDKQIKIKKVKDCFTEEDLFPEELESKFNRKIEGAFGDILSNKLLIGDTIELSQKEINIFRAFFIFHAIRASYTDDFEKMEEENLKRCFDEAFTFAISLGMSEEDAFTYAQNIFAMATHAGINEENYLDLLNEFVNYAFDTNFNFQVQPNSPQLCHLIADDSSHYFVIWDSSECGEEFILPKITKVNMRDSYGPVYKQLQLLKILKDRTQMDKMSYVQRQRLEETIIESMFWSGDNFIIYPISATRVLVAINDYFNLFFPRPRQGVYRPYIPKILKEKQFYDHFWYKPRFELFEPCSFSGQNMMYNVKQLTSEEVYILNALALNEEREEFVFHNFEKIRNSIYAYENTIEMTVKMNDYKNLL